MPVESGGQPTKGYSLGCQGNVFIMVLTMWLFRNKFISYNFFYFVSNHERFQGIMIFNMKTWNYETLKPWTQTNPRKYFKPYLTVYFLILFKPNLTLTHNNYCVNIFNIVYVFEKKKEIYHLNSSSIVLQNQHKNFGGKLTKVGVGVY